MHLNSVTIYKMSNGFEQRAVVGELDTFAMSHPILIVAVQFFWIHIIFRLRFDM